MSKADWPEPETPFDLPPLILDTLMFFGGLSVVIVAGVFIWFAFAEVPA